MLNRITMTGRLVRDPELRTTPTGASVCTVTIACERDFAKAGEQREADFMDVVCWNGRAEFVSRYFGKGQMLTVDGRLQSRKWTDKSNQNRVTWEIIAESIYFGESRRQDDNSAPAASGVPDAFGGRAPSISAEQAREYGSGFEAYEDDDVPF